MQKQKSRTMFYRRAIWFEGSARTLEDYLVEADNMLGATIERTFDHNESEIQGLKVEKVDCGLFFHVAAYTPDQPASLVPLPSEITECNTSTEEPPDDHNFLNGDIFFLVAGNDITLCPSGARESVAVSFIDYILRKTGFEDVVKLFKVEAVSNMDKLGMIEREGVKKLSMNTTVFEASTEYLERQSDSRQTKKKQILGGAIDEVFKALGKDKKEALPHDSDMENLSVKLEISYDSRKKGGFLGKQRLEETAEMILNDDEDHGFTIVTSRGNAMTANEIRVRESVKLTARGNSVFRTDARDALEQYYGKLKSSGILEQ